MATILFIAAIAACAGVIAGYPSVRATIDRIRLNREALEVASDGVLMISDDGTIVDFNSTAERTFGCTRSDAIGRNVRHFVLPEIGTTDAHASDQGIDYLRIHAKLNGNRDGRDTFPLNVRTCHGRLRGKPIHAVLVRDESRSQQLRDNLREHAEQLKTAKRALEQYNARLEEAIRRRTEELEQARSEAEQANEAKGAFLARVSHELRTPLHGILSFSRFGLRKYRDVSTERLVQYFERIESSGESLLHIINELLDLSKLNKGKDQLELVVVDLVEVAEGVIDSFFGIATDRRVRLELHVVGELRPVAGDPHKLAQVLRNLVGNAMRFSPERSNVVVVVTDVDDMAVVSVYDEGPGIPPEDLNTIFDEFVQSKQSDSSNGGTGLGLAISKKIVELHGGWIRAENREEGGAIVGFSVPFTQPLDRTYPECARSQTLDIAPQHIEVASPS